MAKHRREKAATGATNLPAREEARAVADQPPYSGGGCSGAGQSTVKKTQPGAGGSTAEKLPPQPPRRCPWAAEDPLRGELPAGALARPRTHRWPGDRPCPRPRKTAQIEHRHGAKVEVQVRGQIPAPPTTTARGAVGGWARTRRPTDHPARAALGAARLAAAALVATTATALATNWTPGGELRGLTKTPRRPPPPSAD